VVHPSAAAGADEVTPGLFATRPVRGIGFVLLGCAAGALLARLSVTPPATSRAARPKPAAGGDGVPPRLVATRGLGGPGLVLLACVVGVLLVRLSVTRPLLVLAAIAGLAAVVHAVRRFSVAVALFTTLTFFERIPGSGHSVTLVKVASAALLLSWIGFLVDRRPLPFLLRDQPLLSYGVFLLVVWAGASGLWATEAGMTRSEVFRLVQMLFLVFLVFSAISQRRDLRFFCWAYVAGAALTSAVVLSGLAGTAAGADGTATRFGGAFGNPNNLAAVTLPAIGLAGFMAFASRRVVERWLLAGCGALLVLTCFLTQSRGGFVGLGVMCVAAVFYAGPARARSVALVLVIVAAGSIYFGTFASSSARQRVTSYSAADSTGRADLWNVAFQMALNHPVQGIGFGNFTVVAPSYLQRTVDIGRSDLFLRPGATQVHNTYLNVLAELGVVGLLLFMAFLAGVFAIALRATRALARAGDAEGELLGRGLVIGAVGMLTAYFFFSAQFEKQLWLVLGSLIALSTLARAAQSRRVPERRRGIRSS
jgi:O-antigen ligase